MNVLEEVCTTRDKVLEAALKLFSQKGYLGATTKEIAKEAGIAEVTLFRYFQSKEKLFEEVLNTFTFLPRLKILLPEIAGHEYQDALYLIAKRFLETLTLRKDMVKIMHSEVHRYPEQIRKVYQSFISEVFKTLASYFNEMQKKGILQNFNTEAGARAFFGMFISFFNSCEFLGKKQSQKGRDDIIHQFVKIFARGTMK